MTNVYNEYDRTRRQWETECARLAVMMRWKWTERCGEFDDGWKMRRMVEVGKKQKGVLKLSNNGGGERVVACGKSGANVQFV